ncbi:MAG: LamG domain-containing protein, partial [bacterium]
MSWLVSKMVPVIFLITVFATAQDEFFEVDSNTVALWRFNEGSGTVLSDVSGNNHGGTIVGASWVSGNYGQALEFDDQTEYISGINISDDFNMSKNITVEALIFVDNVSTDRRTIAGNIYIENPKRGWLLRLWHNQLSFVFGNTSSATWVDVFSDNEIPFNKWIHVVGQYDGNYLTLYIDGIEVGNSSSTKIITDSDGNMSLGGYGNLNRSLGINEVLFGKIDEIRISNIARYGVSSVQAPQLISYAPDPTSDLTPTLNWLSVIGASNYKIQIDQNSLFSSPLEALTGGNLAFTPSSNLSYGKTYWRVSSDLDYSVYSAVDDFTIQS